MVAPVPLDEIDAIWAFDQYEAVRPRLPQVVSSVAPASPRQAGGLVDVADEFDAFFLDAFGVLNVGAAAVASAPAAISALAAQGKHLCVLTNGATSPATASAAKYEGLGFHFELDEVISSRDVLAAGMASRGAAFRWGVAAPPHAAIEQLPGTNHYLDQDDASTFANADGFVLLSSLAWSETAQCRLTDALTERARPLLVGNPDLVAPHESRFSLEPGYYAHRVADAAHLEPEFYGKPFGNAFDEALARLERRAGKISLDRIAMVGDTLHTDVLGGAAAGLRTILVSGEGLFRGHDAMAFIERSAIVPDIIVPTT